MRASRYACCGSGVANWSVHAEWQAIRDVDIAAKETGLERLCGPRKMACPRGSPSVENGRGSKGMGGAGIVNTHVGNWPFEAGLANVA